jgi:hypothetical protein
MFKEYFQKNEEQILKELKNSKFENTSKALLHFYEKSLSIYNVVNMIVYEKDFYPCIVLIRSQIEHFIVASYIWIQFRIQENDNIASTYYEEYLIQEVIKRLNYAKQNNISMSSRYSIIFRKILDLLTDKKIINQKHIEGINIEANQFDIRKINKFYDKILPLDFDNIIKPEIIKQFLEYYNYFSSFVHGGPSADAMINEKDKDSFIEKTSDIQVWSQNIVGFHRLFIVYFLAMNNDKIKSDLRYEMEKL